MTKVTKSFKSYISKLKWIEDKKIEAEKRKEAKKALAMPKIFISDRSDNESEFHRSKKWG